MTTADVIAGPSRDNIHPAFIPVWNRIPERGKYSPWAYVEYWPHDWSHGHSIQFGDGLSDNAFVRRGSYSIETASQELADQVLDCRKGRHSGHITEDHNHEDAKKAYSLAMEQLETFEYDRIDAYYRWLKWARDTLRRHPPAVLMIPDIDGGWKMGTLNHELDLNVTDIPNEFIGDLMAHPRGMDGFIETELGYQLKKETDNDESN